MIKNIGKKLWLYKNPITEYTVQGKFSDILTQKFLYENLLKIKKIIPSGGNNEQQK